MAVVYLDLDDFKRVNDTLGHGVGDVLLKRVAGRLLATVREEDTVARLGGDEFALALWEVTDAAHAAAVADRAVVAVAQPHEIEGQIVRISVSAGVSLYPLHGLDADTLMRCADAALYEAKRAGRNAYRISDGTDGSRSLDVPGTAAPETVP
jgi:diguanylate cyclase (GGDEF)-like protein